MLDELPKYEKQAMHSPNFAAGQLAAGVYEATLPEKQSDGRVPGAASTSWRSSSGRNWPRAAGRTAGTARAASRSARELDDQQGTRREREANSQERDQGAGDRRGRGRGHGRGGVRGDGNHGQERENRSDLRRRRSLRKPCRSTRRRGVTLKLKAKSKRRTAPRAGRENDLARLRQGRQTLHEGPARAANRASSRARSPRRRRRSAATPWSAPATSPPTSPSRNRHPFGASGPLLIFNASKGNKQALLLHVYAKVPAPTTFVVPVKIKKAHGKYGTNAFIKVPTIVSGSGSVTSFKATIGKKWTYKGKKVEPAQRLLPDRRPLRPRRPRLRRRHEAERHDQRPLHAEGLSGF